MRDLDVYAEDFRDYANGIPLQQRQALAAYELHLRGARSRGTVRGTASSPC